MPEIIDITPKRGRPRKIRPESTPSLPQTPLILQPISDSELLFTKNPLVHVAQRQAQESEPPTKTLTLDEFAEAGGIKLRKKKKPRITALAQAQPASPLDRAKELLQRLGSGQNLSSIRNSLGAFVANHRERSEILQILLAADDQQTLVDLRADCKRLTDFLRACANRGDLTVSEGVALACFLRDLEKTTNARLDKSMDDQPRNSTETLERLCHSLETPGKSNQFKNVPPHSREILRKLQFKVKRIIEETTTTATERITSKA